MIPPQQPDPRMMAVQMLAQRMQRPPMMQPQQGMPQLGGPEANPRLFFAGQWVEPTDPRYPLIKRMIMERYGQTPGQNAPQGQMPGVSVPPGMGGMP